MTKRARPSGKAFITHSDAEDFYAWQRAAWERVKADVRPLLLAYMAADDAGKPQALAAYHATVELRFHDLLARAKEKLDGLAIYPAFEDAQRRRGDDGRR